MTLESVQMLFALLLGFAVAGMCSSGYRVVTTRLPSFSQLSTGPGATALAAIGRRQEGRRFEFVFLATLIAGFWSLMSGTFFVMTLRAAGLLA